MTTATARYEIDIEDVAYLRHGDKPQLARLYKPRGTGPFPLVIDLHGGAWCEMDRTRNVVINTPLAQSGVVVAALDFRMPPEAGYPGSLIDINYGVRWFKSRAAQLKVRADAVGVLGISSGGHQGMLTALRPKDPRYAALPLAEHPALDATLRCVVMCWPVVNPLGRYQYAQKHVAEGTLKKASHWIACHDRYWGTPAAMEEASPVLLLERGEKTPLPPVLYIQGTADIAHPRADTDRFVANYRKAGGRVELNLYEGKDQNFTNREPGSPETADAIAKIIAFVHRELA
jgi:acetyl esterase/lipase